MKTIKAKLNSDQRQTLLNNLTFAETLLIFNDEFCFIHLTTASNTQKAIYHLSQTDIAFEDSDTQEEMIAFKRNNRYSIGGNEELDRLIF